MVSLIQLEYIVALAQYQSFSLAAEKCFVTQPTLSMQIKKMENDLDVILFDRTKKPVTPTEIGSLLIEQARTILTETEKITELVQISRHTLAGKLRIGILPSIAPYLLPNFIGKFAKKYTGLDITVKELISDEIMQALENDQLDVGILATPLPKNGFNIYPLFYERILLYCHKNHDFAKRKYVDAAQMKAQKIWLMSHGNCFRNQVINLCDLKEDSNQTAFSYESASIQTLIKLVETEGGITVIPELASEGFSEKKKQLVKPFHKINPVRQISLISNRVFVKKRMIEALSESIKGTVNTEMLDPKRGEIVEWN